MTEKMDVSLALSFMEEMEKAKTFDTVLTGVPDDVLTDSLQCCCEELLKNIKNGVMKTWRHCVYTGEKVDDGDADHTLDAMKNYDRFSGFNNEQVEFIITWLIKNASPDDPRYALLVLLPQVIFLLVKEILTLSEDDANLYMVAGGIHLQPRSVKNFEYLITNSNKQTDKTKYSVGVKSKSFIFETLEEAYKQVEVHELQYTIKFATYFSRLDFGKGDIYKRKHKVYWKDDYIPFVGMPYFIVGHKTLDCHHGKDRNASQRRIKSPELKRASKKYDCPAQVIIKEIVYFPEYKINLCTDRKKTVQSKQLRIAIDRKDDVQKVVKFLVLIPDIRSHLNHAVGEEAGNCQRIDSNLKQYINELVQEGVSSTEEMKRHLTFAIKKDIFNYKFSPALTNKRFYPPNNTIRLHMRDAFRKFGKTENIAPPTKKAYRQMCGKNYGPPCRQLLDDIKKLTHYVEFNPEYLQQTHKQLTEISNFLKTAIATNRDAEIDSTIETETVSFSIDESDNVKVCYS